MTKWIVTDNDWDNTWEFKTLMEAKMKVTGIREESTFGKPIDGEVEVYGPLAGSVTITKKGE